MWRTGAGNCTTISFNTDVLINNQTVRKGKYALFTIPERENWIIILNTDTLAYGAYNYDKTKDVIRVEVPSQYTDRYYEALTIDIDFIPNDARIYISWLNTQAPYGNNPAAGKYYTLKDGTTIYYELYGKGKPFVLLHGGVYGYIDEFEPFIGKLAEHYQVICIATRGHGKSEIGQAAFTWEQRADDALQVIRSITRDSIMLLGFSDGGYSAYKLATLHPSLVKRMIVIGASDRGKTVQREKFSFNSASLLAGSKEFFNRRLSLMPQPDRWDDVLSKLNHLYNDENLSAETFEKIQCPVLLMSGDRDQYHTVEGMIAVYKNIKNAHLHKRTKPICA